VTVHNPGGAKPFTNYYTPVATPLDIYTAGATSFFAQVRLTTALATFQANIRDLAEGAAFSIVIIRSVGDAGSSNVSVTWYQGASNWDFFTTITDAKVHGFSQNIAVADNHELMLTGIYTINGSYALTAQTSG